MPKKISDAARSEMMKSIRACDTGPELIVRRGLHSLGYRYRIYPSSIIGKPDLVLRKWNVAIFIHGCFWHAHSGCKYFRMPKTRTLFWQRKLSENTFRDSKVIASLQSSGWRIAIVWECSLRRNSNETISIIDRFLTSKEAFIEIPSSTDN